MLTSFSREPSRRTPVSIRMHFVLTGATRPLSKLRTPGGAFYHSMQANLKRRLTNGFLFGVAYTWSKSLDYGSSNGTNIVNAYNNAIMYGPSDFDTRHVMVANYVWDIPYGTHASNAFVRTTLGNWQFSGTIQGQSGRPQTVSQNNDRAGVGPGSGNQFWVATTSADSVPPVRGWQEHEPVVRAGCLLSQPRSALSLRAEREA